MKTVSTHQIKLTLTGVESIALNSMIGLYVTGNTDNGTARNALEGIYDKLSKIGIPCVSLDAAEGRREVFFQASSKDKLLAGLKNIGDNDDSDDA